MCIIKPVGMFETMDLEKRLRYIKFIETYYYNTNLPITYLSIHCRLGNLDFSPIKTSNTAKKSHRCMAQ